MKKYKLITVVGARPQIIKSSALSRAIHNSFSSEIEEIVVHTGQHYDHGMSNLFFDELQLKTPAYNLGVGGLSDNEQIAKMLVGLEDVIHKESPDAILVYGDTNSTLAGALASSKCGIPLIHVEAGLRSFDKSMPEETNRIITDHLSSMLFVPTIAGIENLKNEGIKHTNALIAGLNAPFVIHSGDIMLDNALHFAKISEKQSKILEHLELSHGAYIVVTIHRRENVEMVSNLVQIVEGLILIADTLIEPIVWPIHPRTWNAIRQKIGKDLLDALTQHSNIKIIDPIGFLDMIALQRNSRLIITDSGGLQKEAFFFRKPCLVLRKNTEWVELVNNGNSVLCDANSDVILEKTQSILLQTTQTFPPFYGNGEAAKFICRTLLKGLN